MSLLSWNLEKMFRVDFGIRLVRRMKLKYNNLQNGICFVQSVEENVQYTKSLAFFSFGRVLVSTSILVGGGGREIGSKAQPAAAASPE